MMNLWKFACGIGAVGGFGYFAMTNVISPPPRTDALALPSTKASFVSTMWNALGATLPQLSDTSKALIIAHAAYESSWGKGTAAREGNNFFNLTAGGSNAGWVNRPVVSGKDTDETGGQVRSIVQSFRAYSSMEEGLADYFNSFLNFPSFRGARQQLINGDALFVQTLGQNKFYTQNIGTYWTNYLSILTKNVLPGLDDLLGQSIVRPSGLPMNVA